MGRAQRVGRAVLSRARGTDRGAGAIEYVGAVTLVAAIVVGVIGIMPGSQLGAVVSNAVCRVQAIFEAGTDCPAGPAAEGQRQWWEGDYVALGDSFSSGEGAGDYDPDTNRRGFNWKNPGTWHPGTFVENPWDFPWNWRSRQQGPNTCHRSANSYSQVLYESVEFGGAYRNGTCSGAIGDNFNNPDPGNFDKDGNPIPPQQDQIIPPSASLVTWSMGGNDLGFVPVLRECVTGGDRCGDSQAMQGQRDEVLGTPGSPGTLEAEIREVVDEARRNGGNPRIVIMGYPGPMFNPTTSPYKVPSAENRDWINDQFRRTNAQLAEMAERLDVEFVDPSSEFTGHGIGSNDSYYNTLRLGDLGGGGDWTVSPGSYHPNKEGQAAMARALENHLRNQ